MNVAYILPSLTNTGPTIVINTLIRNIIDKISNVDVYYFDEKESMEFPCPTHRIDFNTRIDFEKYNIVHSNMYRPDKYINKFYKTIDHNKTKLISTIHQDIFNNLKYSYNLPTAVIFNIVWKHYLKCFDHVAVISHKLLDLYKPTFPQSSVVYNGVDIDYNPSTACNEIVNQIITLKAKGLKVIGTYAAINKRKGIDQLFNLLDIRKDIGLVIIGEGAEKERLRKLAGNIGHKDRVLFFPYLKQPYNYLKHIDIYAMPSRSEGFGLAMIEAALTHTPIICSSIDVFHEIFNDSQAVFFELENTLSLSNAVDKATNNSFELSEQGYIRVKEMFTGDIMGANYLLLYNQLKATI